MFYLLRLNNRIITKERNKKKSFMLKTAGDGEKTKPIVVHKLPSQSFYIDFNKTKFETKLK